MKILFLSSEAPSDSTLQLQKAFTHKGHRVLIEDPRKLSLQLSTQSSLQPSPTKVFDQKGKPIRCDLVLPRFGMYTLQQGLHILRALEASGIRTVNHSDSILKASNKLISLSLFAKTHLPIPLTTFFHMTDPSYEQFEFQYPLVLKLPIGSQGKGVALIEKKASLLQWIELLRTAEKEVILQEYIRGQDIRVLVLKGQVMAAMARTATKNDFRANLSLGGIGKKINLTPIEETLAIEAAQLLGLEFCGIDLIRTRKKSYILEANAFPGIMGISEVTKKTLAKSIATTLLES